MTFLNITLRPGSWITAVQPFAFANAWISFSRAICGAVFTFSAGQQGSSRFSKIMQYFRLSRRSRTNVASSSCGLGAQGPSCGMSIECVVRLKAIARLQIKLRRWIASAWSHDRNRGLSSWSSRNTIGIKPSITFPSLNFCRASSASEEFIGCECTMTKSSRDAPSLRIHAMINCLVIFMR